MAAGADLNISLVTSSCPGALPFLRPLSWASQASQNAGLLLQGWPGGH